MSNNKYIVNYNELCKKKHSLENERMLARFRRRWWHLGWFVFEGGGGGGEQPPPSKTSKGTRFRWR
jgi:hypothetical protein